MPQANNHAELLDCPSLHHAPHHIAHLPKEGPGIESSTEVVLNLHNAVNRKKSGVPLRGLCRKDFCNYGMLVYKTKWDYHHIL